MPSRRAASGPKHRDAVRPLGMPHVGQRARLQIGPHRAKQFGRRGVNRQLERGLVQRVLHGRRADQRIADIDFAHRSRRHHAVQSAQPLGGIPRNRLGIDRCR